jgi:hypothetical protein
VFSLCLRRAIATTVASICWMTCCAIFDISMKEDTRNEKSFGRYCLKSLIDDQNPDADWSGINEVKRFWFGAETFFVTGEEVASNAGEAEVEE